MTLSELARLIGGTLSGDGQTVIRGVADLRRAGGNEVAFLANIRYERYMADTQAAGVIVAADYDGPGSDRTLIRCENPYLAFRQAMVAFYGFREAHFEGVDSLAQIDPSAELSEGVRIGAFATVAADCRIGENTAVYPGVHIGPRCRIGRDCTLYSNVVLYEDITLGDRVTLHAGTSIGQDGFGYAESGTQHERIPAAGCVVVEDDVDIGACCTIDRATIDATIIGAGTKISNLVAIGHGTRLGKGCLLVAQAGIAGSTEVGEYCAFGGQAGVVGHIRVGSGARIGAKSGVTHNVAEGQEVLGAPAWPLAEARRVLTSLRRLPQIRTAVRRLTRELAAVKRRLAKGQDDDDFADGTKEAS